MTYALLERLHGHVAVLGLAVLLHPVLTLWKRKRGRWLQVTADLGALLTVGPFALGWWLYPTYRARVKPELWADQRGTALLFESKEHLAFLTVCFALSGALTLRAAGRTEAGRRAAWALLLAGWCCGVIAAALGLWVSSAARPAW